MQLTARSIPPLATTRSGSQDRLGGPAAASDQEYGASAAAQSPPKARWQQKRNANRTMQLNTLPRSDQVVPPMRRYPTTKPDSGPARLAARHRQWLTVPAPAGHRRRLLAAHAAAAVASWSAPTCSQTPRPRTAQSQWSSSACDRRCRISRRRLASPPWLQRCKRQRPTLLS